MKPTSSPTSFIGLLPGQAMSMKLRYKLAQAMHAYIDKNPTATLKQIVAATGGNISLAQDVRKARKRDGRS